jgi:hypothetical protein
MANSSHAHSVLGQHNMTLGSKLQGGNATLNGSSWHNSTNGSIPGQHRDSCCKGMQTACKQHDVISFYVLCARQVADGFL